MAELISITGTHHNPLLPRLFREPDSHPGIPQSAAAYEELSRRLDADRADVLLVVANDHLNELFFDNMPPFMVGKAPQHAGPFDFETKMYDLPRYEAAGHPDLATHLVRFGAALERAHPIGGSSARPVTAGGLEVPRPVHPAPGHGSPRRRPARVPGGPAVARPRRGN